jgi:hypothetical protein
MSNFLANPETSTAAWQRYYQCKLDFYKQYNNYELLVYLDGVEDDLFKMNMIARLVVSLTG